MPGNAQVVRFQPTSSVGPIFEQQPPSLGEALRTKGSQLRNVFAHYDNLHRQFFNDFQKHQGVQELARTQSQDRHVNTFDVPTNKPVVVSTLRPRIWINIPVLTSAGAHDASFADGSAQWEGPHGKSQVFTGTSFKGAAPPFSIIFNFAYSADNFVTPPPTTPVGPIPITGQLSQISFSIFFPYNWYRVPHVLFDPPAGYNRQGLLETQLWRNADVRDQTGALLKHYVAQLIDHEAGAKAVETVETFPDQDVIQVFEVIKSVTPERIHVELY